MPTKIEWTDETWNPITGCTKISEGCQNCYAERRAKLLSANTTVKNRERYDGFRPHLWPERLNQPAKWKTPRKIFVCSMGDLFHDAVSTENLIPIFSRMHKLSHHTFIVLTKRPENALRFCREAGLMPSGLPSPACSTPSGVEWPGNCWLGVTAENQDRADERIPTLLELPAPVRFVSVEPMLSSMSIRAYLRLLDWVICGGETGPRARPMNPDWARSLRDQCKAAGAPFFFKQWGEFMTAETLDANHYPDRDFDMIDPDGRGYWRVAKNKAGRLLDGRVWNGYPECRE